MAVERQVVGRTIAIAEAAGGILGLKKISGAERKVIDALEAAFADRGD